MRRPSGGRAMEGSDHCAHRRRPSWSGRHGSWTYRAAGSLVRRKRIEQPDHEPRIIERRCRLLARVFLVELRPDAGARLPREQADALATVAEREEEEPRAPVLARRGMADHGAVAVVDLALLARRGLNHGVGLGGRGAAELADVAHDARVGGGEAVGVDEVLPDGHRVAPAGEPRRALL